MKLVHAKTMDWQGGQEKHRGGGLSAKELLSGEEGTPENYRLILGGGGEGHVNPRHRHNFDQLRVAIKGSMSVAKNKELEEGQIGYFPEGTWYGPQVSGSGERMSLVMQFGGASGGGFISTRQMKEGYAMLAPHGEFKGGVYRRAEGKGRKNQDAFEAVWEAISDRKIEYPEARFIDPIIMAPAGFAWVPDAASPGVSRKLLGSYTERGTTLEMLRLEPGAQASVGGAGAVWVVFAFSGAGSIGGESWFQHSALETSPGEKVTIAATEAAEFLIVVLPLLAQSRQRKKDDIAA